jgi:predicted alpha/beta-hydrolase family hydrolase
LRTAHLPQLRCPVAFVHGTADPFGSPDELRAAARLLGVRCSSSWWTARGTI